MTKSILEGKQILAVDDEPDVLQVLEEEILIACPNCRFDRATTYIEAVGMMVSLTYDLVLIDVMGIRGLDLLNLSVMRNFPTAVFASNPLNPDILKRSFEIGARACFPKTKLREIVPFLEATMTNIPGWRRLLKNLKEGFKSTFRTNSDPKIGTSLHEWAKWKPPLKSH